MLKFFRVHNFKSLLDIDLELNATNVLVGDNNSGKTNLLQALQFLSLTAQLPLLESAAAATGDAWNLPNIYFDSPETAFACTAQLSIEGVPHEFSYELRMGTRIEGSGQNTRRVYSIVDEKLTVKGGQFDSVPTILLENVRGDVVLLHEQRALQHSPDAVVETTAPTDSTMLRRLYDLQTNRLANAFKRYLTMWQYYDLDTCQLRQTKARAFDLVLQPSGSNLASVLNTLKTYDERLYRKLLAKTTDIEPFIDVINFVPVPGGETIFMFIENSKGKQLSVSNMSNGTLRFMALLFIILRAGQSKQAGTPPLVMVEEPENGICIRRLKQLFEILDEVGEADGNCSQFLFSSHAGYFIDLFDKHLESVAIMEKGESGKHSALRRVDVAAARRIMEEKMPLGEMHFRDIIPKK